MPPKSSLSTKNRSLRVVDRIRSDSRSLIGVLMGSRSDWDTMRYASEMLERFKVAHDVEIVSAHRTPDKLFEYAAHARSKGLKVLIAGAGGAAHLPGMLAAKTTLPVLAVPVESKTLRGLDSLLSIIQMPGGIPVPTLAIGVPGAINAALAAVAILALHDSALQQKLTQFRDEQTLAVLADPDPRTSEQTTEDS